MAMMGAKNGERGSYPEIVNALAEHGAQGKIDAHCRYNLTAAGYAAETLGVAIFSNLASQPNAGPDPRVAT